MAMSRSSAATFAAILEAHTGQQLGSSRHWRIEMALAPLMRLRKLASLDHLADALSQGRDPALAEAVSDALLNNETFFYREPAAFDLLGEAMLAMREARAERRLAIWCAGCSTGQEAYSLAMRFAEDARWEGWTIDILGTDVSRVVIAQARSGLYSQFEIQRGLPVRAMMRWFDSEGDRWRASAALRGRVRFACHNLLDVPPAPSRCDVILCRNVLLYFAEARRTAVFERLAGAIAPDGILMLGAGETALRQTDRFQPDGVHRGLYRPRP